MKFYYPLNFYQKNRGKILFYLIQTYIAWE